MAQLTNGETGAPRPSDDAWPPEPRPGRWRLATLTAAILVVVLLLGLPLFLLATPRAPSGMRGGPERTEVHRLLTLSSPTCPSGAGEVVPAVVGNVTFSIQLVDGCTLHPQLQGGGSEANGSSYNFTLGEPGQTANATGWLTWTSPDGQFGVGYDQHLTVDLWCEALLSPP